MLSCAAVQIFVLDNFMSEWKNYITHNYGIMKSFGKLLRLCHC